MSRISFLLLFPATVPLLTMAGLSGCGPADSDQEAREKLERAYALRAAGDTTNTHVALAQEVSQTQSTNSTLAMAHELVADISIDQAAALIAGEGREPEPGLGKLQTNAIVLAEQANRLATALAISRAYIETEQGRDPRTLLEDLDGRLAAVRSGEGWVAGPEVDGTLPALEEIEQQMADQSARLADLNQQIAQLDQQRMQMLSEASEFDEQSAQQEGQQSVDTYRKVADLRTTAAEVAAGAERLRAQVRHLSAQLEQNQALRGALEQAIAVLQQQHDAVSAKWAEVQTQIAQIDQSAQATFASQEMNEERGNPQSSLELMARELAPAFSDLGQQHTQAAAFLAGAATSYQSAAAKLPEPSQRDELFRAAFAEAFNRSRLTVGRASALRQLGSVHASSAAAYAALFQLEQTLQEAGRDLPEAIQQALAESVRDSYIHAVDAAATAFMEANQILSELTSGGSARGPVGQAALSQHAAVIASLWGLQSLVETTGVPVTVEILSRDQLDQSAKALSAAAKQSNAPLPAAAPFVGVDGATTVPATQPSTEPATQGAETAPETTQPGEAGEGEAAEQGAQDAGGSADGAADQP